MVGVGAVAAEVVVVVVAEEEAVVVVDEAFAAAAAAAYRIGGNAGAGVVRGAGCDDAGPETDRNGVVVAVADELAGTRTEPVDAESRLAFFCGVGLAAGVALAGVLVVVGSSSCCCCGAAFLAGVFGIGGTGGAGSESATD